MTNQKLAYYVNEFVMSEYLKQLYEVLCVLRLRDLKSEWNP